MGSRDAVLLQDQELYPQAVLIKKARNVEVLEANAAFHAFTEKFDKTTLFFEQEFFSFLFQEREGITKGIVQKNVTYQNKSLQLIIVAEHPEQATFILIEEKEANSHYHDLYRSILDSTAEGIYGIDLDGNCTFCNKRALAIFGYEKEEEILGKNSHLLFHHSRKDGSILPLAKCRLQHSLFHKKETHDGEDVFWRKDGTYFIADYYSFPLLEKGKVVGAIITFMDVTEQKKVYDQLKESERSKRLLLENLPGMAYRCLFDRNWTMKFVSKGCHDLTGYADENLIENRDLSFNDVILEEYREDIWKEWQKCLQEKKKFRGEYQIRTADNKVKWVFEQGEIVYDDKGKPIALEGLIIDISEQKEKQQEIRYLSYHDGLTKIHNRIYFEIKKQEYNESEQFPLSIIMGDVNGLKIINDAFGHQIGDELLVDAAKLLQGCCREQDLLARIGGDEFAILLPNTTKEEAYQSFYAILKACEAFKENNPKSLYQISISLGLETKENKDEHFEDVQKRAEDNMYKSKLLDRNSSHSGLVSSIRSTLFEKSQETEEHAQRLQQYTQRLGIRLKVPHIQLDELSLLSMLHDIGKVGIDDEILRKPGPLSAEEWHHIKRHPEIGYRICMASPELVSIASYILSHHERWDGTGYPQGLKGEEIPLLARILAVVDAFDAMIEGRVYRLSMSITEALEEIKRCAGTQFDPFIANTFIDMIKYMH